MGSKSSPIVTLALTTCALLTGCQGAPNVQWTLFPEGFHGSMGVLYSKFGQHERAEKEFKTEKQLNPNSAAYMDLLSKTGKEEDQ